MADSKHPRKFSEEFKRQMVELYDNGKPTSEILEGRELIELRKENRQLKMENDILKQAALIFA